MIVEKVVPIGNEMKKIMEDKDYIDDVLNKGRIKASKLADSVLNEVYKTIGLYKT